MELERQRKQAEERERDRIADEERAKRLAELFSYGEDRAREQEATATALTGQLWNQDSKNPTNDNS
ncbi:hypothetical protein KIN20_020805 [Parelaphostrongylus tenuis]|uniref:Uncharacterized protein n=1 Tax=Parelaphostrongylus tenuis TaxID=148309 RepID=A0AAD5N6D0_PARTN|nr:hypothetical protein KIN20_020805 [Parelaphostrongylus tenuis]